LKTFLVMAVLMAVVAPFSAVQADIQQLGFYAADARDIVTEGQYAYIAVGGNQPGLLALDVSDPTNPVQAGFNGGGSYPECIVKHGNYVLVGNIVGIRIYDVSDPTDPAYLGARNIGQCYSIDIEGSYAYAMANMQVTIMDISSLPNMPTVSTVNTSGQTLDMQEGMLYVNSSIGHGEKAVQIYDVTDPVHPAYVTFLYEDDTNLRGVKASGNLLIASTSYRNYLYWIADPAHPVSLCSFGGNSWDFEFTDKDGVANHYLFASGSLRVYDLSDPAHPQLALTPGIYVDRMSRQGSLLYCARFGVGVRILDISDYTQPEPRITVNPASLDFGALEIGGGAELTFDIGNDGAGDLTVSDIAAAGDGFSVAFGGAFTVAPDQSATVTVTYNANAVGDASGAVTITSDDPYNPEMTVNLSGSCFVAPRIAVDPLALDFGSIEIGGSGTLPVNVTNVGSGDLTVSSVTAAGAGFSSDFGGAFVLAPNAGAAIQVTYNAQTVGEASGTLTIASNDAEHPETVVSLSGTCFAAPRIAVDPLALDFGSIEIGGSGTLPVNVTNVGSGDLTIASVTAAGAGFSSDFGGALVLAPNASAAIQVTYNAQTVGEASGTLTIASNDAEHPETVVSLSGTCFAVPQIAVEPLALDFGEIESGASASLSFTVTSVGSGDLTVESVTVAGNNFAVAFSEALVLAPNESVAINVTFTANTEGESAGTVTIVSNDADNPEVTVSLSGSCAQAEDDPWTILAGMDERINELQANRVLNRGQANSLRVMTRNVLRDLNRGRVQNVLNSINALINHINGLMRGRVLPVADGEWLIAQANIIAELVQTHGLDYFSAKRLQMAELPSVLSLVGAYPNPFNSTTTIKFGLPEADLVKLMVFDMSGRKMATLVEGYFPAGYHQVELIGSNLQSGIYFVRMTTLGETHSMKVNLIK